MRSIVLLCNVTLRVNGNGLQIARLKGTEEFQMGNVIRFPEVESADCVPTEEQIDNGLIGAEYRDAVACLHGIIELSPRTAHQIMRKIVGVYRSLATIADGELE
jgi:hypothetical protein